MVEPATRKADSQNLVKQSCLQPMGTSPSGLEGLWIGYWKPREESCEESCLLQGRVSKMAFNLVRSTIL